MLKELKNTWLCSGFEIPKNAENGDIQAIKKYIAEGGEYEKFDWLADAKQLKLQELQAFILAQKTEPFQKLTAPEVVSFDNRGRPIMGAPVKFKYYNGTLPNSTIKSADIVNSASLDYLQCLNTILLRILSLDSSNTTSNLITEAVQQATVAKAETVEDAPLTSAGVEAICFKAITQAFGAWKMQFKRIYGEELSKGCSLYPCEIIRTSTNEAGETIMTEERGVVNIFPIVFDLKSHIEYREKVENRLLAVMTAKIEACQTVEEVNELSFK